MAFELRRRLGNLYILVKVHILPSATEVDLLKADPISIASFLDDGAVPSSSRGPMLLFLLEQP